MCCITACDTSEPMSYDITSIDELLDELGGNSSVGRWLGITPEAVANWRARGNIPPGWHWKLATAVMKRGKTIAPAVFGVDEDDAPFLGSASATTAAGA